MSNFDDYDVFNKVDGIGEVVDVHEVDEVIDVKEFDGVDEVGEGE